MMTMGHWVNRKSIAECVEGIVRSPVESTLSVAVEWYGCQQERDLLSLSPGLIEFA
jgi:hypothetical protein